MRRKKSISPIIATLILIVITVIAGIFLYGFVSGYMGMLSGTTNQPPPNVQFISSSFQAGAFSNFTFVIYNAGSTAITLQPQAMVINSNNMQTITGTVRGVSQSSLTIPPDKQATVNVTVPGSELSSGNSYYVKFSTTSGYVVQSPITYVQLQIYDVVPITITNSQSDPTPAPFQQMIQINIQSLNSELSAKGYNTINSEGSNVRFYLSSISPSNELYAWLESINNGMATYWVKLPNGIGSSSSVTVYMVVESPSTNFDGIYLGEAPELSPTYGEYDNGQYVFSFYQNFAGTNLPSGWTETVLSNPSGASGSYSVNNGLTVKNTNGADFWDGDYEITLVYYNSPITATGYVWEANLRSLTGNSHDSGWTKFGILIQNSITDSSVKNGEVDMVVTSRHGYAFQWQSGTYFIAPSETAYGGSISYPIDVALIVQSTSSVGGFYGSSLGSLSQMGSYEAPTSMSSTGYVGIFITAHNTVGATSTGTLNYFLARAYPPKGIMPTITIKAPTIITGY